jgi:hypothetical protein
MLVQSGREALHVETVGIVDSLVEDCIIRFTDGDQFASFQRLLDVVKGPPGSLDLIFKLFNLYSQLPLKLTHLLL